jgi:predicted aspartyl protease
MKSTTLLHSGVAYIAVAIATLRVEEKALDADEKLSRGVDMRKLQFLWDTGATQTTILKQTLVDELGYTDEYIAKNRIVLPDNEKPTLADGTKADVYKLPATRMNIGGYEIQPKYIYTSDTVKSLRLLLGMDILQHFRFTYDFDAVDTKAPYGKLFYILRDSRLKPYTAMGEPFAYQLSADPATGTS